MLPLFGASLHNSSNATNIAHQNQILIKFCHQEEEYVSARKKKIVIKISKALLS